MRRFENRSALITAAGSGLGRAMAFRLAQEGAVVTIWDRDADALAEAEQEARDAGLDVTGMALDMTDAAAIDAAVARMLDASGQIDILVNNIGGSLHTPFRFLEQSEEDWDRVMSVNVTACVRTTRAVLPHMVAAGYGRVINMGSKAGRFGSLFAGANYAASKGAMQAFTLQIAQEFGPAGITCNTLCPGAILTPRVERLLSERQSEEERAKVLQSIPVRRHGTVEDIAAAVAYLASEEAGFVNGASLDINGGQAMVI
ncbi:3-oxoacyl-[acyl-carrier protein] reductase/2-hydroxycyclohexanecarboxyl-CoA dehydrogenase [Roseovarius halotolerans]|uniref:3-oxoacyl-[acyl-carrier-protein] reductase FabG n=1 Tax=Roseovarius halotolerans TaxID=505353 RepID=A0A1X6Y7R0_9RHOB|nr:SDR family NAD(P)-dependent oxidoreductase [Roseovarius halotolerans]RKT35154.1 3-oxoacyl-[acyl-carrier protein] reductase/2-hydroxycyclohexanecarboxyl-CoA dehydrogenase [Roseovarius halotolerans]SLN13096.1 3-oxoacyl-[acyl-carrier-protein] reductase FabG [Roseovarius halotolerans]